LAKRASLHRTEIGLLEKGERVCRIDALIRLRDGGGSAGGAARRDRLGSRTRDERSLHLQLKAILPVTEKNI
jgi:hypothetical protein